MSRRALQEDTCDRYKASQQFESRVYQQSEPPLPCGWTAVKVGARCTRHLCVPCSKELCAWIGIEQRTEAERFDDSVAADNGGHGR